MHYHWNISNRISPSRAFKIPVGEEPLINVVRPLGGKSKNGEKLLAEDTYKWDGSNYVYDWAPLKKQIANVQSRATLYQLLIDNPPWAFQRGLDFKGEPEVETYGNAWPPNDPEAWASYLQAMMRELIKSYGREQVEKWRYCIGREIGTAGHWRGTREEFFQHYQNTERAIHAVVPQAQVGTHFLWGSSRNAFGPDFVKWCHQHKVRYDFVGVSYYPFYQRKERTEMEHVYAVDFAPMKDIPEWNSAATLEIHEFALIKTMSAKGNSYEVAPKDYRESFTVMLAKMMYEHEMFDVFRWGTGRDQLAEQALLEMENNLYYTSSQEGSPSEKGGQVSAIFCEDESAQHYAVLVASYNVQATSKAVEPVTIGAQIPLPPETKMERRTAIYQAGELKWSEWESFTTEGAPNSQRSQVECKLQLEPFSFQKVEFRALNRTRPSLERVARTLTQKATGAQTEVVLVALEGRSVVAYGNRRRYLIPLSSLSQGDVEFVTAWSSGKK